MSTLVLIPRLGRVSGGPVVWDLFLVLVRKERDSRVFVEVAGEGVGTCAEDRETVWTRSKDAGVGIGTRGSADSSSRLLLRRKSAVLLRSRDAGVVEVDMRKAGRGINERKECGGRWWPEPGFNRPTEDRRGAGDRGRSGSAVIQPGLNNSSEPGCEQGVLERCRHEPTGQKKFVP